MAADISDFLKSIFLGEKVDLIGKQRIPYTLSISRERTDIHEKSSQGGKGDHIHTILSNRCQFNADDLTIVVRTQFIHEALRFSACILSDYETLGPFSSRKVFWDEMWDKARTRFDMNRDKSGWAQVYVDGHLLFSTFKSKYSDVIEKCLMVGDIKPYHEALTLSENLFEQEGTPIFISSEAVLMARIKEKPRVYKCGIVNPIVNVNTNARSKSFFSFNTAKKVKNPATFQQIIELAADFMEVINLTFLISSAKKQLREDEDSFDIEELRAMRDVRVRRDHIEDRVITFESLRTVKYRPERPKFKEQDDLRYF